MSGLFRFCIHPNMRIYLHISPRLHRSFGKRTTAPDAESLAVSLGVVPAGQEHDAPGAVGCCVRSRLRIVRYPALLGVIDTGHRATDSAALGDLQEQPLVTVSARLARETGRGMLGLRGSWCCGCHV